MSQVSGSVTIQKRVPIAAICIALLAGAFPVSAQLRRSPEARPESGGFQLRFLSEVVRIAVALDSVTVEGTYRLLSRAGEGRLAPILYPYPLDDRMGKARTVSLECRVPGKPWQPLGFRELPGGGGAAWSLPLLADTLEVRTLYRQGLHADYARYIVTTTQSWGRPLERARFEILLPRGAEAEFFSFPFEPGDCGGRPCFVYETTGFFPDRDIEVRWRGGTPAGP